MFGKPEWFRVGTWGSGLHPVAWQGWVYSAVWLAVILLPILGLLARGQYAESWVWSAASLGLLAWDTFSIRQAAKARADRDVLYILDEGNS